VTVRERTILKIRRAYYFSVTQEPGPVSGVYRDMADVPKGSILGSQEDPTTGKPIDTAPIDTASIDSVASEDLMTCPGCGGVIDLRDLAQVLAHLAPLPHPAQSN